jgi:uncharacterized protein YjbJ (UPF0337 family)
MDNSMDSIESNGSWDEQKDILKQKFAVLNENNFMFDEGKKEEILERIQQKLSKSKDELRDIISPL